MSGVAQRVQLGPFFDQGELCGAALLYHYAPGSSTTKNIWSANDMASNHTLANPFVSDANGIFNFFADGYYKLVIKKADGTQLHSLDNWSFVDVESPTLSLGDPVSTASSMTLGESTWAHWTGSVDVESLAGSALFYWAIADGNFTLVHSSALIMPDARNRKVLAGDALLFLRESANTYRLASHMQKEGGWTGRQGVGVAADTTLDVPTDGDFVDISGATTVVGVNSAQAGYRFRARFTGPGLNITHHAVAMISPWGRDYRTVPNEIMEFQSLGAGNWIFYTINGPKERVGTSMECNTTTLPNGYLWENGQAVNRADYHGLYQEIGNAFGAGNGMTTFNLPDAQGRVTITVDGDANRITSASVGGGNADVLGGTGGSQTHTLVISETPSQSVNFTAVQNVEGSVCAGGGDKGLQTNSLNVGGSDGAHSNTQPWIAKQKIIRF